MLSVAQSSRGAHFGDCGGDGVIVEWGRCRSSVLQVALRSLWPCWETWIMQDVHRGICD